MPNHFEHAYFQQNNGAVHADISEAPLSQNGTCKSGRAQAWTMQVDNLKTDYLTVVVQDLPYPIPWLKRLLACIFREYKILTTQAPKMHLSLKGRRMGPWSHSGCLCLPTIHRKQSHPYPKFISLWILGCLPCEISHRMPINGVRAHSVITKYE